jgi:hypothetical protein
VKAALAALPAGFAVALSSVLFNGRPGDWLLLGGTGLILAGAAAWAVMTSRNLLRRERARRRAQALVYAELKAALTARYGDEP